MNFKEIIKLSKLKILFSLILTLIFIFFNINLINKGCALVDCPSFVSELNQVYGKYSIFDVCCTNFGIYNEIILTLLKEYLLYVILPFIVFYLIISLTNYIYNLIKRK